MLQLEAARYLRVREALPGAPDDAGHVCDALSAALARQVTLTIGDIDPSEIASNVIASTTIILPLTTGWFDWSRLKTNVSTRSGVPAEYMITAYECASWGYGLRYCIGRARPKKKLLVTVIDVNFLNFAYMQHNANWGHSGFGIATLLLDIENASEADIEVGVTQSTNNVADFVLLLRRKLAASAHAQLSVPYFNDSIFAPFTRSLPVDRMLPNLHAEYGHCFGSDPWIGLIEHANTQSALPEDQPYLATSIALSGYWAIAEVTLSPSGRFSVDAN